MFDRLIAIRKINESSSNFDSMKWNFQDCSAIKRSPAIYTAELCFSFANSIIFSVMLGYGGGGYDDRGGGGYNDRY